MSLTEELTRIDDELRRAYDGDAWHGPPLREVLMGITAGTAEARHPRLVHSIWEQVNHIAAWVEVVALRIREWREVLMPEAGDFPAVSGAGDAGWSAALDNLDRQHALLLDVVAM